MAPGFSIRGYTESMRGETTIGLKTFGKSAKDLPKMTCGPNRWWKHELEAFKAAGVHEDDEKDAPWKGYITSAHFKDVPPTMDGLDGGNTMDRNKTTQHDTMSKVTKLKRTRVEEVVVVEETSAAGEGHGVEGGFTRGEALDQPSLCEELDSHKASKEYKVEYHVSNMKEKMFPISEGEENEKINNFLNKGHEKETKQRDRRQGVPLRSILKKGTSIRTRRAKHVRFLEVVEASRDTGEGTTEDKGF